MGLPARSSFRLDVSDLAVCSPPSSAVCSPDDPDLGRPFRNDQNELREKLLCKNSQADSSYTVLDPDGLDIACVHLPVNSRYSLTVYGDASFAIGLLKQNTFGYVIYLKGTPILRGSLKQTIVVDSSCSAEFVAASVAVKQLLHAENMIGFLGFTCVKALSDVYQLYGLSPHRDQPGKTREYPSPSDPVPSRQVLCFSRGCEVAVLRHRGNGS